MNIPKALNIRFFQWNVGFIIKPKLFHPLAYTVLPCDSRAPESEGHESTYNKQKNGGFGRWWTPNFFASGDVLVVI